MAKPLLLLSAPLAADYLGVGVDQLRALTDAGKISFFHGPAAQPVCKA